MRNPTLALSILAAVSASAVSAAPPIPVAAALSVPQSVDAVSAAAHQNKRTVNLGRAPQAQSQPQVPSRPQPQSQPQSSPQSDSESSSESATSAGDDEVVEPQADADLTRRAPQPPLQQPPSRPESQPASEPEPDSDSQSETSAAPTGDDAVVEPQEGTDLTRRQSEDIDDLDDLDGLNVKLARRAPQVLPSSQPQTQSQPQSQPQPASELESETGAVSTEAGEVLDSPPDADLARRAPHWFTRRVPQTQVQPQPQSRPQSQSQPQSLPELPAQSDAASTEVDEVLDSSPDADLARRASLSTRRAPHWVTRRTPQAQLQPQPQSQPQTPSQPESESESESQSETSAAPTGDDAVVEPQEGTDLARRQLGFDPDDDEDVVESAPGTALTRRTPQDLSLTQSQDRPQSQPQTETVSVPEADLPGDDDMLGPQSGAAALTPPRRRFSGDILDELIEDDDDDTDPPAGGSRGGRGGRGGRGRGRGRGGPTVARRAGDDQTWGGNAHSGPTGNASGGYVDNDAEHGNVEEDARQTGGTAGVSFSGDAYGGRSFGTHPGGNAYTGNSGRAEGGMVMNYAKNGKIIGTGGSTAGAGGISQTGQAYGGNVDV